MKPVTRLYLKIFLSMGIGFAAMMALLDVINGEGFILWKFIFLAISNGLTMSLLLVSSHVRELKKQGIKDLTDDDLKVNQEKEISIAISKEELFQKLKTASISKNASFSESKDEIILKSKANWRSWGETIRITYSEVENGIRQVSISSKPKVSLTQLDFGRNRRNVDEISELLMKAV